MSLYIPIVVGTARPGNHSTAVAKLVAAVATEFGFEAPVFHPEEFATTMTANYGAEVDAWAAIAEKADGFVVVTPEYNHSFPGELKLLLDKAYDEYNHKPIGMVSVAAGAMGGSRVLESLLPVWNAYRAVPLRDGVIFRQVHSLFTDGEPTQETMATYTTRLQRMFAELQVYANGLQPIREQLNAEQ